MFYFSRPLRSWPAFAGFPPVTVWSSASPLCAQRAPAQPLLVPPCEDEVASLGHLMLLADLLRMEGRHQWAWSPCHQVERVGAQLCDDCRSRQIDHVLVPQWLSRWDSPGLCCTDASDCPPCHLSVLQLHNGAGTA